jgi:hypothetical protein
MTNTQQKRSNPMSTPNQESGKRAIHRYFTRQPKPARDYGIDGLDFKAIGGPEGFCRWEPVRRRSVERFAGRLCRWHRLDCQSVWHPHDHTGFRIEPYDGYTVRLTCGVLNVWSGSCESETVAVIFALADGGWELKGTVYKTLLSAIRAATGGAQ